MDFQSRRKRLMEKMENDSVLILYSGVELQISADAYHDFEANRHFFYLTGLRRDHMALVMTKANGCESTVLYIPAVDEKAERWTGRMVKPEEAMKLTGIDTVRTTDALERDINRLVSYSPLACAYFDTFLNSESDLPHYNHLMAQRFAQVHPGVPVRSAWPLITALRMEKDAEETAQMQKAIALTDEGLKNVLRHLKPGMTEYQAQAHFEFTLAMSGADGTAFPTIAGSGLNGTMTHYETNRDVCRDGSLLLLDLGARLDGYNADITRTYPVNGKYSERQRAVYDIVLKANREVARQAKPGMTLRELNDICKKVLAEGCISLGLIQAEAEIGKYYMHSVSHHLGIDVHDTALPGTVLTPGCVITDEPGLYIDEWEIGIRIEDDLLITQEGCTCLSENIMRTADEIEAYMRENRQD